jgi:hypothetical protein
LYLATCCKNPYLLVTIGFDAAENEPSTVYYKGLSQPGPELPNSGKRTQDYPSIFSARDE